MLLVDTNIFLEFLLGRAKREECGVFLNKIIEGEIEGVLTLFSLHSIGIFFVSRKLFRQGYRFLWLLGTAQGLSIYYPSLADQIGILRAAQEEGLDFDDALQYFAAKKLGAEAIVSFDRHFDGLGIPRTEPKDCL